MRVPATLPTAPPHVMGLALSPIQKLYTSPKPGRRLPEHCWEAIRQPGTGHLQSPWIPLSQAVQEGLRSPFSLQFLHLQLSNWNFQLLWEIVHMPDVQTTLPKPHLASELSTSPISALGTKTFLIPLKTYFHPVLCRYLSFRITIESLAYLYWAANWLLQPNINIHEEILALRTISLRFCS